MSASLEAIFSAISQAESTWEASTPQPSLSANEVEAAFDAVFSEISIDVEEFFPLPFRFDKQAPLKFKAVFLLMKETTLKEGVKIKDSGLETPKFEKTISESQLLKVSYRVHHSAARTLTPAAKNLTLSRSELLFFPKKQSNLEKKIEISTLQASHPKTLQKAQVTPHKTLTTLLSQPVKSGIQTPVSSSHAMKASQDKRAESLSSLRTHEKPSNASLDPLSSLKETPVHNFSIRKDQEKDKEQQQRQQDHPKEHEKESTNSKKKQKANGIEGISPPFWGNLITEFKNTSSSLSPSKPRLEPPKIGVFALYYILDKMGLSSECTSYREFKGEIETLELESSDTHKKMLEEMQKAIEKERETTRWSTAAKVFSWIGTFTAIISGVVLIATGVGAVAGALLVAGGVISLTNQIMEMTGGWKKVAEILPGEDTEKKRAVVTWIQIGIGVLCLILSGAGIVFGGGFSAFGEASSIASSAMNAVATMGLGTTLIGKGISDFLYKNRIADTRKHEIRLAELKHRREDLMEALEDSPDRLLNYYESMARQLGFLEEINRSYQRAW